MSRGFDRDRRAGERITWVGAIANLALIGVKLVAGLVGRSQALIADAVHSISDLFSDVVVLFGLRYGRKEPDADHHFGHARIETMAAAVVGVSLALAALYIGYEAASDLAFKRESNPGWLAVVGAGASILIKEVLYRYTLLVGKRIKSPVVMANAWHHRTDALSSVAVLIGVVGAQIRPEWHLLDPIAALVVALFILKVSVDILMRTSRELSDKAPPPEVMDDILMCARGVSGVLGVHDVKVRTFGGVYQMQLHVVVDGEISVHDGHQIARAVSHGLKATIADLKEVVVHIDPEGDENDE